MRQSSLFVFDDFISGTASTWYSGAEFNAKIGQSDFFAVVALLQPPVSGTSPTITVASQHSVDGRNWIATGVIELSAVSIANNGVYSGSNAGHLYGGTPLAPFVRLAITLGGTNPQGRLKLYVTARTV